MNHPDQADWKTSRTPEDHRVPHSAAKLAIASFIASEAMFFLLLIVTYIVFNRGTAGSSAANVLKVGRSGIFTILLLASSMTLWRAERGLRDSNQRVFLTWLAATLALGVAFLCNQAFEYAGLIHGGLTIGSTLFGSTFFTLTGFHGLHVFAGLVMLGVMFVLGRRGHLTAKRSDALSAVGYYWHFVDVVWIVVFSIVYLRVLT